jgi:hypothetical protein
MFQSPPTRCICLILNLLAKANLRRLPSRWLCIASNASNCIRFQTLHFLGSSARIFCPGYTWMQGLNNQSGCPFPNSSNYFIGRVLNNWEHTPQNGNFFNGKYGKVMINRGISSNQSWQTKQPAAPRLIPFYMKWYPETTQLEHVQPRVQSCSNGPSIEQRTPFLAQKHDEFQTGPQNESE